MNILHKKIDDQNNILGSDYIYETNNYFVDISIKNNIIKFLYITHKDEEYKMSYDCERFMVINECYKVVHIGELSFSVNNAINF